MSYYRKVKETRFRSILGVVIAVIILGAIFVPLSSSAFTVNFTPVDPNVLTQPLQSNSPPIDFNVGIQLPQGQSLIIDELQVVLDGQSASPIRFTDTPTSIGSPDPRLTLLQGANFPTKGTVTQESPYGYSYSYSYSYSSSYSSVTGQGFLAPLNTPLTIPYILRVFPNQLPPGPHTVMIQIKDGTGAVTPSGIINFSVGGSFGTDPNLSIQVSPPSATIPPTGSTTLTITINSINNLHSSNPTIVVEAGSFPGVSSVTFGVGDVAVTTPPPGSAAAGQFVLNSGTKTISMTINTNNAVPGPYSLFFKARSVSPAKEAFVNVPISVVGSGIPTLLLNPSTVNPGGSVTFDGFNFSPHTTVSLTMNIPGSGTVPLTVSQLTISMTDPGMQDHVTDQGRIQGVVVIPSTITATGTFPVTMTASDGKTATSSLTLFAAGASDFQLNVSPQVLNLPPPPPPGQTQDINTLPFMEVTFTKIGTFNSPVTIQPQGLPPGVTAQFDNNGDNSFNSGENTIQPPTVGTVSSILRIKFVSTSVAPFGFFPISMQGSSGSSFKFMPVQLAIPPPISFGGTGTGGIGVLSLNPPAGPAGTTVTFNGIAPSGFGGSTVSIRIAESNTNLATATVSSSDNTFSGTFTAPSSFTGFGGVIINSPSGSFPIKAIIMAGPTLFADFTYLSGTANFRAEISPPGIPPVQQGGTSSTLTVTATSLPGKAGGTVNVAVMGLPPGMQVKFDSGAFGTATTSTMTLPAGGSVSKAIQFQASATTPPGPVPIFIDVSLGSDKFGFPVQFGVIPSAAFQTQFGFASVFLSKPAGSAGDDLTITASGFNPNSNLQVFFGGLPSDQIVFTTTPTTDSTGSATIPIKVPSLASGTYPVRVRDALQREAAQPFTIAGTGDSFSVLLSPSFLPPMQQGDNPSPNTVSVTVNVFTGRSLASSPVVSIKGLPPGVLARFDAGAFSTSPSTTLTGLASGGTTSTTISFQISNTAPPGPFSAFVEVVAGAERRGQPINSGIIPKANFFTFAPTTGLTGFSSFNAFTVGTVFVTPPAAAAGDVVTLSASGFTGGATPTIQIFTFPSPTSITLPGGTTFDGAGSFSQQIRIPATVQAGQYELRVSDGTRIAETRISVVGGSDLFRLNVSPEFLPPAPQGGNSDPVQITATALTGKNAGTVTVSLSGLPPGVTASFDGVQGTSKTLSVGTGGTASTQLQFTVGNSVPPGPINVVLRATTSAGGQVVILPINFGVRPSTSFVNLGGIFAVGSVIITPSAGSAGDAVSLTASGFTPNVPVTIIFGGNPATDTLQLPSGTTFDSNGFFSSTIRVPTTLASGTYPVVVSDGIRRDAKPFTVVAAGANFDVSASPPFYGPITQGSSSSPSVITINSLPGKAAGTVTLTVLGLPPGVTVAFDGTTATGNPPTKTVTINSVGGSEQISMALNVPSTAPPGGPYFLTLKASDGTTSRNINMGFGVIPSGPALFLAQFGSLIVTPLAGKANDPVTISASGFTPGAAVTLTFGASTTNLAPGATFAGDGTFNTSFKVPTGFNPGFYKIRISDGTRSDVEIFNVVGATQQFQLSASPQFQPPVLQGDTSESIVATVSSAIGNDSPAVTLRLDGLAPGMTVKFDGVESASKVLDPGVGESLSTSIQIVTTATTPPRPYPLQLVAVATGGEFRSIPIGFGVMPKIGTNLGFASLIISPGTASAGDTITLTGTGYVAATTFSSLSVAAPGQLTPLLVPIGTTVTVASDGTWNTQIKIPSTVNPGFYRLIVTSGTGTDQRMAEAPLSIIPSAANFFNVGVSPDFVSVKQGDATGATATMSIQSANAFSSALSLKVSGLAPGLTVVMKNFAGATLATFTGTPLGTVVTGTSPAGSLPSVTPDAGGTTTVSLTVTASSKANPGPYMIFVGAEQSSGDSRGKPLAVQVTPASGDSLVLSPNLGPAGSTVSVIGSGFAGAETVALKFGGITPGTSGFTTIPSTVTALGGQVSFQITVPSLSAGVYLVELTGSTSGKKLTTQFQLIPSSDTGGIFMQVAPKLLFLQQGSSAKQSITISPIGSFNSAVTLTATGLPTGVSAAFSPSNVVTPTPGIPTTVTVTFSATSTVNLGIVPITIVGTPASGTAVSEKAALQIVSSQTAGDFIITVAPKDFIIPKGGAPVQSTIKIIAVGTTATSATVSLTGSSTGVTTTLGSTTIAIDSTTGIGTGTLDIAAGTTATTGLKTFTVNTNIAGIGTKSATVTVNVVDAAPSTLDLPPFDPSSVNPQTPLPLNLNFGTFTPQLTIKSLTTDTSGTTDFNPQNIPTPPTNLGGTPSGFVGVGTNVLNIEPSSSTTDATFDMCFPVPSSLPVGVSANNVKIAFLDISQTPPVWTVVTTVVSGGQACATGLSHFSQWSLIAGSSTQGTSTGTAPTDLTTFLTDLGNPTKTISGTPASISVSSSEVRTIQYTPTSSNPTKQYATTPTISSVAAGTPLNVDFGNSWVTTPSTVTVTGITLTPASTANNVVIAVRDLNEKPPSVTTLTTPLVGKYIQIDTSSSGGGFSSTSSVTSITMNFKVDKSWATSNNVDLSTVQLHILDGSTWTALTTTRDSSADTSTQYGFIATLPHLSTFAIGASQSAAAPAPTTTSAGSGGGAAVDITTYPESYFEVNPLAKIQLSSTAVIGLQGADIAQGKVGRQLSVTTSFKNYQGISQKYAYIVQIEDKNRVVIDLSVQTGIIESAQTITLSKSWTPEQAGRYIIKIFIWDSVHGLPIPLAYPASRTIGIGG